ncbi:MAG: hypothetical protein Q7V10_08455 [Methanobacteriaceae archaeon]|nr:hypothetical protein [Methanobacteriaceae archaeon]MDO9627077.1 hypothetical protein [Methanobacteriaceae archaeon]
MAIKNTFKHQKIDITGFQPISLKLETTKGQLFYFFMVILNCMASQM